MKSALTYLSETGKKDLRGLGIAMDIANNGYKILAKPKYADVIKFTVHAKLFNEIIWLDAQGNVVAASIPFPDYDYPMIGEVIEYEAAVEKFRR